jgi:O-methyltransferase
MKSTKLKRLQIQSIKCMLRKNNMSYNVMLNLRSIFNKKAFKSSNIEKQRVTTETPENKYANIPDASLYKTFVSEWPFFLPWLAEGEFSNFSKIAIKKSLVSKERLYILYTLLNQAIGVEGYIWECGVYKGGTAAMMAAIIASKKSSKKLYLFDTFEGMPETNLDKDIHLKGDFSDASLDEVRRYIGHESICFFRQGIIPESFLGLEYQKIAFAHIDLDIYQSIIDSLDFIWPRLTTGGFLLFDDYGFASCPGAREAVDKFFTDKLCIPLCLPTGQAIVYKSL